MKIFISEYILFYETFDLNLYEELNISSLAFDYMNYYESLCNLNNRFTFKPYYHPDTGFTNIFLRKKQYAYDFFWRRRYVKHDIFRYVWSLYLLPRRWMKNYARWGEISMAYKFFQYSYLNELVGNFYVDHKQIILFKSEYPKYDCALIFNHSYNQFNRKIIWLFEHKRDWMWRGFVFYRPRPVYFEFLKWHIRFYIGAVDVLALNPRCYGFTTGNVITYAKKWVYWTYHIYNYDRSRPFVVYGFWTENFFTEIFQYRVISYRFEFFRDSIYVLGFLVGSTEVIQMYIYFFLKMYIYFVILFFFSIFFSFFYSREKLLKLILLDEHLGNFTWLYSVFFNHIATVQSIVRQRNIHILKKEGRKLERKSQLESKLFKIFKNLFYIPLIVIYLENFVNTKVYRNWVERCFLGSLKDFDTYNNYVFLFLIFLNTPFRFFSTFKTAFYKVHMFYYFTLNNRIRHSKLYNARSNYSFNRFFSPKTVHRRELDRYSAWDIIERIINFINIYSKREYKDLVTEFITHAYQTKLYARTRKRKDEYFEYFYYRTFGNYDPEVEFFQVQRSRFFTRWWYYSTDFSFNILTTHQLYMFFNYIHSPLHVRSRSSSVYNFYYILYYSKIYFYYYYYIYFFFLNFINVNFFLIYIHYFFSMLFHLNSLINNSFNFVFDGRSHIYLRYFWWDYMHVIFLWLKKKYFFVKYIYFIILFFIFTFYYICLIVLSYIKLISIFVFNRLFNFFSSFNTDLGLDYSFWHRYYLVKFYLIEYNVFYHIFIFIRNFFFNFLLIFLFFFVLTTIPYFKELIFSDYLIYNFYSFFNKIFEYNKFIYFNEVLDNWWVPYFSPKKFVHFYNGYCNYFELRLKKMIGKYIVYTAHLGKRKFGFNKFFFDMYFKRYLHYLQWNKFNYLFETFRRIVPGSFPWELYIYMHGYFLLVKHPARHFMPEIYWNTLPIMLTYVLRYKYFYIVSKIFIPIYWFWKYSFSFIIFNSLVFFENTIFFNFIFMFFKGWYNFYVTLNYYFFYFCYYYYFYFFFTVSKLMRYYFVTYDFLNYFWVYRSARFIIILDIFNLFRMLLDSIYFFFVESFYGFFYFFYKIVYFILNFFGLISFLNYLLFSINFIPKIHVFISELFDKFVTINYDLDEYGRILSKHFRHRTRYRIGDWPRRDLAVRSVYKMVHRTISFEFKFRQFLFYNKKGLMRNFLIYNKIKVNTFNLFFFSFLSLYLNYLLIIFCLSLFSLTLHKNFKTGSIVSASPFFEWERFTKKNRHLLGRDEFYWLYNIRWLNRFEFYVDKCFSDDLYTRVFDSNEVKFGYYLYNQWSKFFIYNEPFLYATLNDNRFLLYKRYYLERYMSIIKDIDFIFHEYSISKKKVQNKIFSFYDFFIPKLSKDDDFDFKDDLVRGLGHADLYWFYFATPQLLYTRNWNFVRVMSREELSKEFYFKLKKSLFKAYSFYEMNREVVNYDFFEFQFFEPEFYDDVIYEHVSVHNSSPKNYFLHRIALSRWSTELVYVTPNKNFFELYAHVGYHDLVDRVEYHFEYLRNLNSRYFDDLIDFSLFGFLEPVHSIVTHIDAETVKNSIDLSLSDDAIGIKYSELYQYEDLGRVATEQYLFTFLDTVFDRSKEDPSINIVALTDDSSLGHRHMNTWIIVLLLLPMISTVFIFMEYIFSYQYILPHLWVRDFLSVIFYRILAPENAEIIVFHKLLTWERIEHFYWLNPWIWTKKHVFDLFWIDNLSFWTGKHARFLQSKEEYIILHNKLVHDEFRYDNLSFLYWNFYIDAWRQCPDAVVIFVLVDFFFFLLCLLFFLFVFNFYLRFMEFYHYFSKKVHLVLDKSYDVEAYKEFEEQKRQEREKKKSQQFDFHNMDVFTRFRNNVDSYKKDRRYKK